MNYVAESIAEEERLADADTFSDWLVGECAEVKSPHQLPDQIRGERTAEDFTEATVADLYRIAIDLGQRSQIRCAAMDASRERYLAAQAKHIDQRAFDLRSAA
jgi:hypothetical protein